MSFNHVAIIGLGLLGGSTGLAVQEYLPDVTTSGYDADPHVRKCARERGLAGAIFDDPVEAVRGADLVILCVPLGAMEAAARAMAPGLGRDTVISDVGSSKESVLRSLTGALPDHTIIPAHPVAGTEQSGPDAGFASLYQQRWCIIPPPAEAPEETVEA